MAAPLANVDFRRLLAVFMLNGIASAVPATLVLFFVADVLAAEGQPGTVPRALLRGGRGGHAAVGEAVGALRQGARVARGDARRGRRLRLGGAPRQRRRRRVRDHLRGVGPDARRRPRAAAVAARRRDRPRSPRSRQPARTSACGRSRPSSISRWRRASRCRCWASWATRRAAAIRTRWPRSPSSTPGVPCILKIGAAFALTWFDSRWRTQ